MTASVAARGGIAARPQAGAEWWRSLGRRLARTLLSFLCVVVFAFFIVHLIPGDPVRASLGLNAPEALVERTREQLGLDLPVPEQFARWIGGLLVGDWGTSLTLQIPVMEVIGARLPATLGLVALAFLLVLLLALPTGFLMAIATRGGRRRWSELGYTTTTSLLAAVPDFLLGIGLVSLLSVWLGWFPIAGRSTPASFALPVLALALGPAAALSRILRAETLAVLNADFARTARSKRLTARRVYLLHVAPSAVTATLTIAGLILAGLVATSVLVESVFAWPGLGPTMVSAVGTKDYPLVQGIVVVYGGLVLLVNLVVDLSLAALDRRSQVGRL